MCDVPHPWAQRVSSSTRYQTGAPQKAPVPPWKATRMSLCAPTSPGMISGVHELERNFHSINLHARAQHLWNHLTNSSLEFGHLEFGAPHLLRALRGVMDCSNSHRGYSGILLTTYNRGFLIKAGQSEASLVITDDAVCSADCGNSLQVKFWAVFLKKNQKQTGELFE